MDVITNIIFGALALVFTALLSFVITPIVMLLAVKVKAVDIPKDDRRMHSRPIPRLGGFAIFVAFCVGVMIFGEINMQVCGLLLGTFVIVALGFVDDIFALSPWLKLAFQIVASIIPIICGNVIEYISLFGHMINFGSFAIPVTMLWIVGLTNAVNLIDGLDGLACGIATISSVGILVLAIIKSEPQVAMLTAMLVGSCVGFLPFNVNPAKIFMGDTGALMLGFVLSVLSIQGLFKTQAMVSFFVPFLIFALPFVDTLTAVVRRLIHGQSPFHADRGHLHHKLIDLGLSQKQSVTILYAISGILAIASVIFVNSPLRALLVIFIGILLGLLNFRIFKNTSNVSSLDEMEHPDISNDKPVYMASPDEKEKSGSDK